MGSKQLPLFGQIDFPPTLTDVPACPPLPPCLPFPSSRRHPGPAPRETSRARLQLPAGTISRGEERLRTPAEKEVQVGRGGISSAKARHGQGGVAGKGEKKPGCAGPGSRAIAGEMCKPQVLFRSVRGRRVGATLAEVSSQRCSGFRLDVPYTSVPPFAAPLVF